MRANPVSVWLVAALVFGAGCSAVVDPDTGKLGNAPPRPCVPGSTNDECACEDGRIGTQRCTDQERYDRCNCDAAPAGTAGTTGTAN